MRRKNLLRIFASLLSLLFSGCASLPDVPVCTQITIARGWCTYTISDREFFVGDDENNPLGASWFEIRSSMVYLPADSWAEIKAYILKKCEQHNECSEIAKKKATRIDGHILR